MSKTIQPLEWVDDLKLGDYALENHTKEFLRFANIFIDAKNVGNGEEQLDNILNNLTGIQIITDTVRSIEFDLNSIHQIKGAGIRTNLT